MRRVYFLLVTLLIISACGITKTFPRDRPAGSSRDKAGSVREDYDFNFPDLPPTDFDSPYPDAIQGLPPTLDAKYRVALLLPLSGKAEDIGQALFDAAQMAAFEKGGDDIAIIPYDTQGNAEGAANAAYDAIEGGANIILGPLYSSSTKRVAPIARTAGVPVMSFSNDKSVAGNGVYIMGLIPDQQVSKIADYAKNSGIKGVSVIIPNDVFGHGVKEVIKSASKKGAFTYRGEEVYSSTYPRYSKTVGDLIKKRYKKNGIRFSSGGEAIMIPQGGESLERILIALQQQGVDSSNVTILGTALWDTPETLGIPELDNALYASVPYDGIERFNQNFSENFGYIPKSKVASLGYDGVDLAVQLSRSGFQSSAIVNPQGFVGVNGAYRFNRSGINERRYEVLEISNGQIIVVEPASYYFQ